MLHWRSRIPEAPGYRIEWFKNGYREIQKVDGTIRADERVNTTVPLIGINMLVIVYALILG